MATSDLLVEIDSLPANLKQEVADFVGFLKSKSKKTRKLKSREFGFAKGKIQLAKDFDEPLEIFKDYM
ncbi:MAG: DUF2281 domain-containing protein [Chryseotalea sp. WA131a]|jgi:hypothetical protein|nr:MAG: DUF2281 domain-containing protein [Chryseotalea sp. WA131a]